MKVAKCAVCGTRFKSQRHNARYCTPECKAIEAKRRRQELKQQANNAAAQKDG